LAALTRTAAVRALWLCSIATLLWSSPPATAGEAAADAEEQLVDDELEEEFELLEDEQVVIAPAKHKQQIEMSPAAVIVITRRVIEESGATSLMELLRRYPALHVYEFDPIYPGVMMRGTIRVLLRIDGREVNTEFFPAPFYEFIPIGIEDIERIEIVLGPNSALYGANAVSAIIDITTRRPGRRPAVDASLAGGEHGQLRTGVRLEGGLGPLLLQGTVRIDRASNWMETGRRNKDMLRALLFASAQFDKLVLQADGGVVRGTGHMYSISGEMDFNPAIMAHAGLGLKWRNLRGRAYWYAMRSNFEMNMDLVYPQAGVLARVPPFNLAGDTVHAELQYNHSFWQERLLLIAGIDGRGTWYRSKELVQEHVNEGRLGVFLHGEAQFVDWLRLTLGGRFDYNTVTKPAFSPRGAVVFRLGPDHTLRLSAGTAFRKPTLIETSANFKVDANPAFADEMRYLFEEQGISNPDLDNEILTGFELGWRGRFWQGRLRAAAEVYFNMNRQWVGFSSDIRFRPPPFQMQIDLANSHLGYDNGKGGYNIVGIHGSLECTPFDGLSLFARGEWRHEWRVNRELDHPNQVTPWQAAAGATLRLPGDMIAHLAAVHVAARHDYVRNPRSSLLPNIWGRLPAETYLMASWRAGMELPRGRLELGLSVFNPFAGRIREKAGIIDEQGHNFGGELLGRLVMLTARLKL